MPHFTRLALAALGFATASVADKLLVSHFSGKVYSLNFEANGTQGVLTSTASTAGCGNMPTWLTLDSAKGTLYCFDEAGAGQQGTSGGVVTSYTVNTDGSLKQTGQANTKGGSVHGWFYGGQDGRGFLASVEYDASTLTAYKLPLTSGNLTLQTDKFTMTGPGTNPSRQDAPHPHSVFPDPSGKYLLVPDLGADLIRIFSVDASTGKLTTCEPVKTAGGDGPRHGAFWTPTAGSADHHVLYTVNELGNSVTSWTVSYPASGCLTLAKMQTLPTRSDNQTAPAGSKAAEVHVSGNFLYAANRNDQRFGSEQDSLVTYSINASSGAITFVEETNSHTWYPRSFAINKAGTYIAMGGQTSSNIAILSRDPATGKVGGLVANLPVATRGTNGGEDGLSSVIWDE